MELTDISTVITNTGALGLVGVFLYQNNQRLDVLITLLSGFTASQKEVIKLFKEDVSTMHTKLDKLNDRIIESTHR